MFYGSKIWRHGQGVGPLKNAQNFICTNYKPWTPALTCLTEEMVIFKCFIAPSQARLHAPAACCKILNINKILQNIFLHTTLSTFMGINVSLLLGRWKLVVLVGVILISWYLKIYKNNLLRPAQPHFPGLDVWSVRTSIELTPNWQLHFHCKATHLRHPPRPEGGRGGGGGVSPNPCQGRDWRSKFIVRIIVLEYIIKYIIKFYFYMKIQDSPSAMTIGSVVKNNGYDHTHYLNISTLKSNSRNVSRRDQYRPV